MFLSSSPAAIC